MKPDQPTRLRLGSFELDLRTGELCPTDAPDGPKVLLQEKPFRVLRVLVDRAGEIATREEIRKKLWPNDTIVDFDHGINVAIGTLRRAFGDSASQPKYVETVARRGYRLMVTPEAVSPELVEDLAEPPLSAGGLIGKKVSHFRVLEAIGGGGMGMVYRAEDLKLGRPVALKFLPEEMVTDPVSLKRFEREAQTASSLNHANICTIFEIEEHDGQPVIVMELLAGKTLRDHLAVAAPKPIPLNELLEIAIQTCSGMQAAHDRGIIHRDIKPANIFLTIHGPAKILDFGLAKLVEADDPPENDAPPAGSRIVRNDDTNLTRTGMAMGTASYMSPEQVRKEELDARTDLFSFGLVLYEMATGQRAFHSDNATGGDNATGVHDALLNRSPIAVRDLNPAVPPALEEVIAKALQKDRDSRYQSAAEMRADLETVPSPARVRAQRIRKWLAIAALLLAIASGALAGWRYLTRFQLSAADTIVIADLTNQTSDTVLDDAVNTALPVELAQTPFLQVLAADKIRETTSRMAANAKITPEIALQVCRKTNSRAVVTSSIGDAGNRYRISLAAISCASGTTFAESSQEVTLRTEIIHALGVAGVQLRRAMGEPRTSVNKFNKPLELATSSSPEALQFVAKAFRRHFSEDTAGTASLYESAIAIDPSFALAYASVGIAYLSFGNIPRALASETKAFELRDRLTGQLRYLAETLYYSVGMGDLEKALPVYQEWLRTFPLDGPGHNNFAGELFFLGQYDRAASESREALRLMPSLGMGNYETLMQSAAYANRLEEAKAIFSEAKARRADVPDMHSLRHNIAFLEHDEPAMREELAYLRSIRQSNRAAQLQADVYIYYGRFREAMRVNPEADASERDPSFAPDSALQMSEAGDTHLMRASASQRQNRRVKLHDALSAARTGDIRQAEALAEEINRESPRDTLVQYYHLPVIRAAIKLDQHDPAGAIEVLRPAEKYELAVPRGFNSVYPAYLRGLALLQLGEGGKAAVEFQKLLDHPAIVGRYITGTLAHLQVGRAQLMAGDKAAARKSYQDFLTLWKGADPDIPIYMQAKAEFARLK